jgi:UDP-glucose-4-epimerase GalE
MSDSVLVTGGAGYVGSHACKALAAAGFLPVSYDNLSTGHRWAVRWGPLVEGDIRDGAGLAAAFAAHRPVAVLHFAAQAYVHQSVLDPLGTWEVNLAGSLTLLRAVMAAGAPPLVFSSTCSLYGVSDAPLLDESQPVRPINPYGASKAAVERLLADLAPLGLRHAALRYFNAAGADPAGEIGERHDPEPHLIPNVLKAALGSGPAVTLHGTDYPTPDGTCVRDYVHVADLAAAHVLALRRLLAGGASLTVNLGSGGGASVAEVIATAERVTGRAVPRRAGPRRPGDPPRLVAGNALARQALGWTPGRSDLETIIADAWAWERRGPPPA